MSASPLLALLVAAAPPGETHPHAAPGITSLTDASVRYTVSETHWSGLRRGGASIVVVDNAAAGIPHLPDHRVGYNGVASLTRSSRDANLFVPFYAGLNFEHIHDGTLAVNREKFEPRRADMQLRMNCICRPRPTGGWRVAVAITCCPTASSNTRSSAFRMTTFFRTATSASSGPATSMLPRIARFSSAAAEPTKRVGLSGSAPKH